MKWSGVTALLSQFLRTSHGPEALCYFQMTDIYMHVASFSVCVCVWRERTPLQLSPAVFSGCFHKFNTADERIPQVHTHWSATKQRHLHNE